MSSKPNFRRSLAANNTNDTNYFSSIRAIRVIRGLENLLGPCCQILNRVLMMMLGVVDREIEHFPKCKLSDQRMRQYENVELAFIPFLDLGAQL